MSAIEICQSLKFDRLIIRVIILKWSKLIIIFVKSFILGAALAYLLVSVVVEHFKRQ